MKLIVFQSGDTIFRPEYRNLKSISNWGCSYGGPAALLLESTRGYLEKLGYG
jgi:hypothetical protein